jgi:citrate synthase
MSPSEVESCLSEIGRLWPRVMSAKGWTKEEKALFAEKAARVHCGQDQAVAAIREYKATVEKFPQVAGLLDRLKRLNPTGTHSPTREHSDPAMHPTLAHMVKRLRHEGNEVPTDPKATVATYWAMALGKTADLLGFVPADRFDGIYRDVMELWHDDH